MKKALPSDWAAPRRAAITRNTGPGALGRASGPHSLQPGGNPALNEPLGLGQLANSRGSLSAPAGGRVRFRRAFSSFH